MRGRPKLDEWPKEFHGPGGESAWFNEQMYVPLNWTPYVQLHPKHEPKPVKELPDRQALKAVLVEKGIKFDPRWSVTKMEQMLKE